MITVSELNNNKDFCNSFYSRLQTSFLFISAVLRNCFLKHSATMTLFLILGLSHVHVSFVLLDQLLWWPTEQLILYFMFILPFNKLTSAT